MAKIKKKTKLQKDLLGNIVKEEDIRPAQVPIDLFLKEDSDEFDYHKWLEMTQNYQDQGDKEKELECYNILANSEDWCMSSANFLRKGTLLVDMGRLEEAFQILDNLYGCESHDTIVASAQLQLARISAISGKEDKMFFYLKEAFRTTVFFDTPSLGGYSASQLFFEIERIREFDPYRESEEFQKLINFDWKREDEIELKIVINDYLRKKKINPKYLDPIRLGLVEFLCKYPESDIYLDFDIEGLWLANSSKSVLIINKTLIESFYREKIKSRSYQDKEGQHHYAIGGSVHGAHINFSQGSLESIKSYYTEEETYTFEKGEYKKETIEIVQKIIEGSSDVTVYDNFLEFKPESYTRSPPDWRSYRVYQSRRDNNYHVFTFAQSLENCSGFVLPKLNDYALKLILTLFKNYPENPIEESQKENYDPDSYADIDLVDEVIKELGVKMRTEIESVEDYEEKLDKILDFNNTYYSSLTSEGTRIFSNIINNVVKSMLKGATLNQIHSLIKDNILYILLRSIDFDFSWMNSYFEVIKEELEKHEGHKVLIDILLYFNSHIYSMNKNLQKLLAREIKLHVIKGEADIIRKVLPHLKLIPKSEREIVFNKINLKELYNLLPDEIEKINQLLPSNINRGSILLFDVLLQFSKLHVTSAQKLLNKKLIANFPKFNTISLGYTTKMLSFLSATEVNELCNSINFDELFRYFSFSKAIQIMERFSKAGYKNAEEVIKSYALNLALENKIKTGTKAFKKYVSNKELEDFLKAQK